MVALTFPDGARREYPQGTTGLDIAKGISPSLAKRTVAMALDGAVADLADPIEKDAKIEFLTREDPRALELIRHDAAHVMAEAVQSLWPGTQVTIGPVIDNGFFYDFYRNEPFTPEDLPVIEKKMREIIARDKPFTKEVWPRDEAKRVFQDKGENFKVELVDAIPPGRGPEDLPAGRLVRSLPRPAHDLDRQDRQRLQAAEGRGRLLARRLQQPDADPHLRHRLRQAGGARRLSASSSRRPRSATTASSAARWTCSISRRKARARCSGTPNGWTIFQEIVSYMRRRLKGDYREVNAPQMLDKSLWETSGHWGWFRENMFMAQSAGEETDDERVFAIKPMNCPGHIQIFKHGLRSYRDLPLRMAEFGVVHRYEPSGALHGLMRVRAFTQDDAHVFCTEEQMADECLKINDLILSTYADFGFEGDVAVKLSTRPEKRVGTDAAWDHAEGIMQDVLKQIAQRQQPHQDRDQSGRRRVLRAEVRIRAARRHRPRLAMRHHAGRLQPAGALRRLLHRRRRLEEDAGDDPPRHLRLDGALPRHPARELRRPPAALARAGAGGGRDHHLGRRRLCRAR